MCIALFGGGGGEEGGGGAGSVSCSTLHSRSTFLLLSWQLPTCNYPIEKYSLLRSIWLTSFYHITARKCAKYASILHYSLVYWFDSLETE